MLDIIRINDQVQVGLDAMLVSGETFYSGGSLHIYKYIYLKIEDKYSIKISISVSKAKDMYIKSITHWMFLCFNSTLLYVLC